MVDKFTSRLMNPVVEELDKEHRQIQIRSKEAAENAMKESYILQKKMQSDCQKAYDKFVTVEEDCNKKVIKNQKQMLHILKCVETSLKLCEERYGVRFDEETMKAWIKRMNDFNKLVKEHETVSHK